MPQVGPVGEPGRRSLLYAFHPVTRPIDATFSPPQPLVRAYHDRYHQVEPKMRAERATWEGGGFARMMGAYMCIYMVSPAVRLPLLLP